LAIKLQKRFVLKVCLFAAMESFDKLSHDERQVAIEDFLKILRFETVSGSGPLDGSYNACGKWLVESLTALGMESVQIIPESLPNKPVVVATWNGTSDLPAILLNSHYDVVPVMLEHWTVPAWEGIRKDSRIYGRGAQDMKCVCAQYLVALRKLKSSGFKPVRTIHISYVPDEEIGGSGGMGILLQSDWYSEIKIDLALDEGLASEDSDYSVFYGERLPWWVRVIADGNTGHGSRFIEGTAVEQLLAVTQRALAFRQQQKDILHGVGAHAGCSHGVSKKKVLGDVTSLNITMLRAGVQAGGLDVMNVVPAHAEAGFDIRISPHMDPSEMKSTLDLWCEEVTASTPNLPKGGGVKWDYTVAEPLKAHYTTSTDPTVNPWWGLFENTLQKKCGIKINPTVFPAATDSRFLRSLGIKAFGFSPIRRSPILLHEHDEYLDEDVYLEGCDVYVTLIRALSSQGTF
jgi:aminoacylase